MVDHYLDYLQIAKSPKLNAGSYPADIEAESCVLELCIEIDHSSSNHQSSIPSRNRNIRTYTLGKRVPQGECKQSYRRNESRREEQVCRKSFLLVTLVQRQVDCNSLGKILSLGLYLSVFWECYLQLLRVRGGRPYHT